MLREQREVAIVGLLTTINSQFNRVAMHAVRQELLRAQAAATGLPLFEVSIPWPCSNADYEVAMTQAVDAAKRRGVTAMAFGDLFLEDIRAYRCEKLAGTGIRPIFPLWGLPTDALARTMIAGGLRARLTCIDPKHVPREFAGREFDASLIADLPPGVDPCGERGEFHTFTCGGPMFTHPIPIMPGEIVERDGFVFADFSLSGGPG